MVSSEGARANDSFGHPTSAEFLIRPQMTIDLSTALGQARRVLEAGIGVE